MSFTAEVKQEVSLHRLEKEESRAAVRLLRELYQVEIEPFVQRRMNLRKNLIYGLRVYGDITAILRDLGLYSPRGLLEKPLQKKIRSGGAAGPRRKKKRNRYESSFPSSMKRKKPAS